MKKLIPALCMLLVAAALLGTSTYAWFSMNETVTANSMSVKAATQAGIVISNAAGGAYSATAEAADKSVKSLTPGSTADLSTWYTSTSNDPAKANTGVAYTTATENTNYVKYSFFIRSSAAEALAVESLDVTSVTVTSATQQLSKALRVGVKIGTTTYIYAPVTGYTGSYSVNGAAAAVKPLTSTTKSNFTTVTSLPANTANGQQVDVYVWYEGEDAACISNNLVADVETLAVSVVFGYTLPTGG